MAIYKSLVKKISVSPDMKTKQKEYLKHGELCIVDQGQQMIGGYSDDLEKKVNCSLPVIVFGDHTRVVKYVTFPFGAGADGTKILEPKEEVLPKYLYYGTKYLVLRMPDKGYARHYQHLEKMDLMLPDISEQERVVSRIDEMFSKLDDGVESLNKIKAKLAIYRHAVIEDSIKTAIEYGAKAIPFGEYVLQYQNGISKRKGTGINTPVIRLADIENGEISTDELRCIGLTDSERNRFLLNKDDILIIRVNGSENNVGRTIVVKENGLFAACDHFIRCTVDNSRLLPEYANILLDSFSARKYIKENMVSSAGQNTISQGTMSAIQVYVPDLDIQKNIISMVKERQSVCDNIERTIDMTLICAEALRQDILKEAFEGRL